MNNQVITTTTTVEKQQVPAGLSMLRLPVPAHLISPLPKGTKAQNECPADQKINCKVCGGWHHPGVRHLEYVGHAAATHILLDADPFWSWEPLAYDEVGLPRFDQSGGLWIRLTVCGHSRLGYGNADEKRQMDAGSREKEVIGDALRNAGMRFGLALELWSKADIHAEPEDDTGRPPAPPPPPPPPADQAPTYPVEQFRVNLPTWLNVIAQGRKTAEEIIDMACSKFPLTEDQKELIRKSPAPAAAK